jgi:hypothetical protein
MMYDYIIYIEQDLRKGGWGQRTLLPQLTINRDFKPDDPCKLLIVLHWWRGHMRIEISK